MSPLDQQRLEKIVEYTDRINRTVQRYGDTRII